MESFPLFAAMPTFSTQANAAPTLSSFATLSGGSEDTALSIAFSTLGTAGNAADTDGSINGFVVKAVSSGTLRIGLDEASASAWAAGSNDVIDDTHLAFWTPAANANGSNLAAFTVVARDDGADESATPVQVRVNVAAVNDAPTLAHGTSLAQIQEDVVSNPGDTVGALLAASGYADVDGNPAAGIAISANGANAVTEGHWEFAADAAGQNWYAVGNRSPGAALLLNAATHLRFVPVADFSGTPGALTVHAVDSTSPGVWSTYNSLWTYNLTGATPSSSVSAAGVAWSITVTPLSEAPVIANLGHGDDQTVVRGAAPVLLDVGADAIVTDIDNATFSGGTLTVAISAGQDPTDTIGLQAGAGILPLAAFIDGAIITVDGHAIGTVAAGAAPGQFALDLSADATPARVSALLQHLTFATSGSDGARTVGITVADGAGGVSSTAETTIVVTSRPTLTIASDAATVKAGQTATLTLAFSAAPSGFALADLDVAGGTVTNLQATADPLRYTATFVPDEDVQDLQAAISIGAGKFSAGGVENAASTAPTLIGGDTLAPTLDIALAGTPAADATTLQFEVTLSEAVTGIDASAFVLDTSGATSARIATVVAVGNAGDTYLVTVADISGNGGLRLSLGSGGAVVDAAGNLVAGGASSAVHTVAFATTPTTPTTPVDDTPPVRGTLVDGVRVVTSTQFNGDGSTSHVTDVQVVAPGRIDSVGGNAVADIPLAGMDGKTILAAQLPTGYGLHVVGQEAPGSAATALADLVRALPAAAGQLISGATSFLAGLDTQAPLLVESITPTAAANPSTTAPLVLAGLAAADGGVQTALVIDTRGLGASAQLRLDDIGFAAIVGAAHVTAGTGHQTIVGDGAAQTFVLGAGDADIDGGGGIDTVVMAGAGRAGYSLRVHDGLVVATALDGAAGAAGAAGSDRIANVEIVQFSAPDLTAAGTIGRLYEAALGRAADTAGREYWAGQHAAGVTLEDVAAAIVDSGEALGQKQDDAAYVTRLYANVLERSGDTDGMAFWTGQLAAGTVTRAGLALQFADSAEKLALPSSSQLDFNDSDVATLVRMYEALFDRKPDEAGLNFWIGVHESGVAMRTLAQDFLSGSESAAYYATLDDAHFVAALYRTALGHDPSAPEALDWAARLADGVTTRADVLLALADSAEMVQLVGTISTSIETV
jgi:hypothetical protein